MKIFKNIIKNKALFISFLAFCFSLFCFATIGYAWVTISKTATVKEFIGVVENQSMDYQFSQIIDDKLVHSHNIQNENTMPGESNTFVLTISNEGNKDANIEVYFHKIYSEKISNGSYSKDYQFHYQKLQYAYSFCIDLVCYVPDDVQVENIQDSDLVVIPDDTKLNQLGWIKISRSTEMTFFNKMDSTNSDIEEYNIVRDLQVNHRIHGDPNVKNKSTVLIYFTIKFHSNPQIPELFLPDVPVGTDFNGEYYADQRFNISNIIIQGLD